MRQRVRVHNLVVTAGQVCCISTTLTLPYPTLIPYFELAPGCPCVLTRAHVRHAVCTSGAAAAVAGKAAAVRAERARGGRGRVQRRHQEQKGPHT